MPPLDSEILGLSKVRALALNGAPIEKEPVFEQIFSFQESTYGYKHK